MTTWEIPSTATLRLSDFLHARDHQIESHTVEITGLPKGHPLRNLNELLEPLMEDHDNWVYDPESYEYFGDDRDEPVDILHRKIRSDGAGLVRVSRPNMAKSLVWRFAGTYWKNATLNAKCVPDEEMDDLIVKQSSGDVQLFVAGFPANTSSTDIRDIFGEFSINDVSMPTGGKTFCFIYVAQADANNILAHFAAGFRYKGRNIHVSISDKKKGKKGKTDILSTANPALAAPVVRKASTDLKVNNLPYGVAESNIRIIFESFTVYKVVCKEGYAFVGIASDEVDRALKELPGKMVGDRKITVKVSERKRH
ncbi:RNP domain-containing [Pyrenophora seminiperda CCB06]|uniref:RNP domain-containing n=1 Tax=Pyrenophora seminiperda CCB06 TaxID=1302712 RepID=A0A3M7M5Q6_9PLEO|nr:RNP domain-containing [Pyrenophora seminiperda CCB06]